MASRPEAKFTCLQSGPLRLVAAPTKLQRRSPSAEGLDCITNSNCKYVTLAPPDFPVPLGSFRLLCYLFAVRISMSMITVIPCCQGQWERDAGRKTAGIWRIPG